MPITVTCKCGKQYRAKQEQAGKRFKCKACGATMIVREPSDEVPYALSPDLVFTIGVAAVFTLGIGLWPGPWLELARGSVLLLR